MIKIHREFHMTIERQIDNHMKASKTRLSIFLKPRSLLIVNDCFKNENNAVFGVFLQRLVKWKDPK